MLFGERAKSSRRWGGLGLSWYLEAIKKYAVFSGRSRREEYWYFVLFNIIVAIVLGWIDALLGTRGSYAGAGLLSGIYSLAVIIPSLAVTVRRLHDIGRTGWWILIGLVPLIGAIVLLVFALVDSTPGDNRYARTRKGPQLGWFEVRRWSYSPEWVEVELRVDGVLRSSACRNYRGVP
jgi:uncharacterized membrane protein YhaH (DUF805 family)